MNLIHIFHVPELGYYVNIYIHTYTTVSPLSCTDGRYFYHISGTASPNQESDFKSKSKGGGVPGCPEG